MASGRSHDLSRRPVVRSQTSCPSWYMQEIHLQERRKMITNMLVLILLVKYKHARSARLLQARKPNAPVEWMQKLPQMARRLEESLFRSAQSFVRNRYVHLLTALHTGRIQRYTDFEETTASSGDGHGTTSTTAETEAWRKCVFCTFNDT